MKERQLSTDDQHQLRATASSASQRIAAGEVCKKTGRVYENGHGALSKEQQTANFRREWKGEV
jgi:hypothetical protein